MPKPLLWAALLVVYFVAGKLGLRLALVNASATAIWPAAGIALAALLLGGLRLWPVILAGAFLVNVTTTGSVLSSAGIAAGNTLEALAGAWLMNRFARGARAFERPRHVFEFAVLAGMLAPALSATLGVTSLWLAGLAAARDFWSIWMTWWLGDVGGELVVAPFLIVWATHVRRHWERRHASEAVLLTLCLTLIGLGMFGRISWVDVHLPFLCLPLLLWAAFRFGPRGAVTGTALLSAIAVGGAVQGSGPFLGASPNASLLLLVAFMAVMSVTGLTVAAAVAQRRMMEEALSRSAAIVDSSDDAIIGKSLDGTIVTWNRGAERLYGYSPAEALGRNVSMLVPRGQHDETPGVLERLRRGERVESYETQRVQRDGRKLAISLTVSPVSDASGRLVGASAIARDITGPKRAEQRLATQFAVTRALADSARLREAGPRILRAVCEGLEWEAGELWLSDDLGQLRLEATWPAAHAPRADDLAERAWGSGQTLWSDAGGVAAPERRAAVAAPILERDLMVGVLAFHGREPSGTPAELVETVGDIGARVGQFLEREKALVRLRRLEKAVETLELGVTITDMQGRILYTNPAEAELHGYDVEDLIGKPVSIFMPATWQEAPGRPSEMGSWRRETVNVRKDGTIFPVQLVSNPVADAEGTPIGFVTCCEEITERKRAEQALRSSEERYRLLFERNLAGVYRATPEGRILECNQAFARILGYASPAEVLARSAWDLFVNREDRETSLEQLRERGALTNFELRLRKKDGSVVWVLENETLLRRGDGEGDVVAGTLVDITDRKQAAARVEFHAYHDPLTDLPNRIALKERMQLALAQARRSGLGLAVMFVDLDEFKPVNDKFGHAMGDGLLREVASRLRSCVRGEDTVARVGGDEFVLLLSSVRSGEGAARVAKKLLERLEQPFRLNGHELRITASVGVALHPQDGAEEEALLRSADAAMYRAKELGKNGYQFCDPSLAPLLAGRLALGDRLRDALARGEMELLYQPELEVGSGRIVGLEALLRWNDPVRGSIPAREFIPLAEQTGLIVPLGDWTLQLACAQARALMLKWPGLLRLSVNVSLRQLREPDFSGRMRQIAEQTGLDPGRLELELSEAAVMQNLELVAPLLRKLAGLGFGISLDDFGVGYSLLSQLKLLPVKRLKIDRSWIAGLGGEPRDRAVVQGIVGLARSLGLAAVAEGIETQEQRAAVEQLGCDAMQGSLFGDPLAQDGIDSLLRGEALALGKRSGRLRFL